MPPRMPTSSTVSSAFGRLSLSSTLSSSGAQCSARCPTPSCPKDRANFSTTPSRARFTKLRRNFRIWINGPGSRFRRPAEDGPNYIQSRTDMDLNKTRPFPLNRQFKSETVLDDRAREVIWEKVMRDGEPIKAVSAELGVDIRRVAAVVRLKEVEKNWINTGKRLAKPYAKAVLSMLPTHSIRVGHQNLPFEAINELHVHPHTMKQIFWPTSESRHFTREDAAKAFNTKMLSADKRVPHPELIQMEREVLQGRPLHDAAQRFKEAAAESERKAAQKQIAKAQIDEKYTTRVKTSRFEFRFRQINAENVGPKGRSRQAVGWKYGAPHYDRAKGQIKIPTSVP